MMVSFIQTSDLHLGATFKSLGDKSKLHRNDCQTTFSKIMGVCVSKKVDALLIAGDLFDKPDPAKVLVQMVIREFELLEKKGIHIFIVPGNHDPYTKDSIWTTYEFPRNVTIFSNNEIESRRIKGLTVYGLAYTEDERHPLRGFTAEDDDDFKVGLVHGSLTDLKWDDYEDIYGPISKDEISKSNLDYLALGHYHNTLDVSKLLKVKIPCYYSGCPEGLTFRNTGQRNVLHVTLSDDGIKVDEIKVNIREFDSKELDCTSIDSDLPIRDLLDENCGDEKILRLVLKGTPPLDSDLDLTELERDYESKYFHLKLVDNIHIPSDLTEDETIRGNFIKLIKAEIDNEEDEDRKKRLENSLRLGIAYLDKNIR
jgi:DNA repair protein SbcD/Mre11